jgi:cell division protein FtsQ
MKRFFQILFSVLFVAGITTLMGYVYYKHIQQPVKAITIHVERKDKEGFLSKEDILQKVKNIIPGETRIKDIDYEAIEKLINHSPWVAESDVFTDIDGDLMINVKEKQPVLRVFPQNSKGFYLDINGNIVPLSSRYAPRVLVANGYLKTKPVAGHPNIYDTVYKSKELRQLLAISRSVSGYPFLNALIGEIYLNSLGEVDLVPTFGADIIRIGNTSGLNEKLENLIVFYKKALVYEGWNKYQTLNLKYKDQIICTKN